MFPLRARAKGMALSTSVNWIANFIIAFITPPLFGTIAAGYYFLLMGFTVISGIVVYFVYPETAGKTLEELGEVFGDGAVTVGLTDGAEGGGAGGVGGLKAESEETLEKMGVSREDVRQGVPIATVAEPGAVEAAHELMSNSHGEMRDVPLDDVNVDGEGSLGLEGMMDGTENHEQGERHEHVE